MNTQVEIKKTGTTTLSTAGKYCDRNIDVNVNVPDAEALVQGTIEGEFVSDKMASVRDGAFCSCVNLSRVSLPNCTSIGAAAFRNCSALESVNLPSCVSFTAFDDEYGGFFRDSKNLKSINIPNLTTIEDARRTFNFCSLQEFNAPNLTSLINTSTMFSYCTKIRKINFPKLGGMTISANTFPNCYVLDTLILGGSELNPLENVNAFKSTPIEKGTGYVYVPDDLVDTYKTATNWAAFADQIKPVSELEE